MGRIARIVVPGVEHHIVQRGNFRQEVFFSDGDYRHYLNLLQNFSSRFGLEIHGYCLMKNHVHLIATPFASDSMAKALKLTNQRYAFLINQRHKRNGHLWQGRYYSTAMAPDHFWDALRYVERNPVRASIVQFAWEYPWSSAKAHVTLHDELNILEMNRWRNLPESRDWRNQLVEPQEDLAIKTIRQRLKNGRPLGDDDFLDWLEQRINRKLEIKKVGRPRKKIGKIGDRH